MNRARIAVGAAVLLAAGLIPGVASAAVVPGSLTVTGTAGQTSTAHFTVGATPPTDVELVFDTTGSLGETLDEAKMEIAGIVSDIQQQLPDTRFAVAQFKDKGDTPEYRVEQAMTPDGSLVEKAVSRLSAKGGGDLPEAYNLAFQKSSTPDVGGAIGWRAPAKKVVVVVGDAEPHGAGMAGIEHCMDMSADPHGLDTAAVLSSLRAAGRTLVLVHRMDHMAMMMGQMPADFECYQGLAGVAGGIAVEGHQGVLHGSIVKSVIQAVGPVLTGGAVELHVTGAAPAPAATSWVSVVPDSAAEAASSPSASPFLVSVAVPAGTPAGTYRFDLAATVGGSDAGQAVLTVKVDRPGAPKGKPKHTCKKTKKKGHGGKHRKAKCVAARHHRH